MYCISSLRILFYCVLTMRFECFYIFYFRTSELVALMAISSTLFLFLHTRDLHTRLRSLQSVTNSASTSGKLLYM